MVVLVWYEMIGRVILVRGQELAHKMAVDVRKSRNVEGDTRKLANTSKMAGFNLVHEVGDNVGGVEVVKRVLYKVCEGKSPFSEKSFVFRRTQQENPSEKLHRSIHGSQGLKGSSRSSVPWSLLFPQKGRNQSVQFQSDSPAYMN